MFLLLKHLCIRGKGWLPSLVIFICLWKNQQLVRWLYLEINSKTRRAQGRRILTCLEFRYNKKRFGVRIQNKEIWLQMMPYPNTNRNLFPSHSFSRTNVGSKHLYQCWSVWHGWFLEQGLLWLLEIPNPQVHMEGEHSFIGSKRVVGFLKLWSHSVVDLLLPQS